ncbi:MAG TPA: DUF1565 domain-containing protein, partial [Chitinophagales bacterium]|nr:DUF1565 domain-containing protein [Chitinophagales bacterium]
MKHLLTLLCFSFFLSPSFAQNCLPSDKPDVLFRDIDGDGIDGDKNNAIFVDVLTGNDNQAGTMAQPVYTITKGIELAALAGKDVYVAKGIYVVSAAIQLVSGVNVYGGFSGQPLWSRSNADTTIIQGISTAVLAENIATETHFEFFTVNVSAGSGPGQSAYGIRVVGGTATTVIRFNTINAGAGSDGAAGGNGVDGLPSGSNSMSTHFVNS